MSFMGPGEELTFQTCESRDFPAGLIDKEHEE